MKNFAIILFLPFLMLINGCAGDIGANEYETSSVGEVNRALKGTILTVRAIQVKDEGTLGTVIGAGAGGVAGSLLGGNDTTKILGAIGGAVVGGMAGDAAQGALSKQAGFEYTVELDNGNIVTVSQGSDVIMHPGQKCLVLYGKRARVVPLNQ